MASLRLEVVTADRVVYSGEVDAVVAPGSEGQLGILPHHAPLLTLLQTGQLKARLGQYEVLMAVSGGFMEVLGNQVTVFADTAERAEEIDLARAQEARRRAEASMLRQADALQYAKAEADLRRSLARIKAARLLRKGRSRPPKLPSSP